MKDYLPGKISFCYLKARIEEFCQKKGYYDELYLETYIGELVEEEGEEKAREKFFEVIEQNTNWILENQRDQIPEDVPLEEIEELREKIKLL